MKIKFLSVKLFVFIALFAFYFISCQKDLAESNTANETPSELTVSSRAIDHPGRALASNCFQCHGTNGYGWEHLAGESANEIIGELREMAVKNPRADIMNVHAAAYTTEEIKLIADFFSKQ